MLVRCFYRFCACFWWEHGHDFRVGWVVGVVAVHAVVALASASAEVPVSSHSSMAAVFVVAVLRAVALSAELHNIRKGNRSSIS